MKSHQQKEPSRKRQKMEDKGITSAAPEDTPTLATSTHQEIIEIDNSSSSTEQSIDQSIDQGNKINDQEEVKVTSVVENSENPFSCFAFNPSAVPTANNNNNNNNTNNNKESSRFQKWSSFARNAQKEPSREKKKSQSAFVPIKELPPIEQERIRKKWHNLVDPSASLENKRFQILVAARLHARCQEQSVKKAMSKLRETFNEFTALTMAETNPEMVAECISNVVHYNVKARHIVKASQEVVLQFGGIVPEDEKSLLAITGIGKVFADLLACINTKAAFMNPADTHDADYSTMEQEVLQT